MKICFETFGCRLNKAEALQREADCIAAGMEITDGHKDADLIVVRGCSVTSKAQRECEKLIEHLHRKYPTTPIKIEGCLDPDKFQALPKLPEVPEVPDVPTLPIRTARAYLKVQDGCSGKCTFCIVPKFRGASKSVPFDDLLEKARQFIGAGYHEIVMTGCNLSLYASGGKRLPELVSALAAISPQCRIRLGSLEPGQCAMETVEAMAEAKNVCRFLHVPVQSGSDKILKTMRRPYAVSDMEKLAALAVKRMSLIGLGCDLMTGFPGETESDFQGTVMLLGRLPFSNVHVFPFSSRPGTVAATMGWQIDREVRSQRAHRLLTLAAAKREDFAKRFVGKVVEIVSERNSRCCGWSGEYLYCKVPETTAPRKSLVRVLVTGVMRGTVLEGRFTRALSSSARGRGSLPSTRRVSAEDQHARSASTHCAWS